MATAIVLTLNGVEREQLMATNKTFPTTRRGFAVSRIEPSWGPFAGGTMVRVWGGFRRLGHVKCRFGNKLPVDSANSAADPNQRAQSRGRAAIAVAAAVAAAAQRRTTMKGGSTARRRPRLWRLGARHRRWRSRCRWAFFHYTA